MPKHSIVQTQCLLLVVTCLLLPAVTCYLLLPATCYLLLPASYYLTANQSHILHSEQKSNSGPACCWASATVVARKTILASGFFCNNRPASSTAILVFPLPMWHQTTAQCSSFCGVAKVALQVTQLFLLCTELPLLEQVSVSIGSRMQLTAGKNIMFTLHASAISE